MRQVLGVLLIIAAAVFCFWVGLQLPFAPDWHCYQESGALLLAGQPPYLRHGFGNPFWALLPALPAVGLPLEIGRAYWFTLSIFGYMLVGVRLLRKPLLVLLFLTNPFTIFGLMQANNDWLAFLGFAASPWLGLILTSIKPQIGLPFILYLLWQGLRARNLRFVLPALALWILSFILYGPWILSFGAIYHNSTAFDASLFPYSLVIGAPALVYALWKGRQYLTHGIGPMLSPYIMMHSWAGVFLISTEWVGNLLLWLATWALFIMFNI
ncbi:MAG: hypothetical protein JXA78_06045 [Anaerolineales bacterium]|nr:hypothetical protein [Anaerolineales bacterium]